MKTAGSAAPIWAIFIIWAAVKFSVQLDRHAERILREFLSSIKSEFQETIRAELDELAAGCYAVD
jgi:Ca-activated chloride channel family protein